MSRIIPEPKGAGRWQIWRSCSDSSACASSQCPRLYRRHRTRINAQLNAWALRRRFPAWQFHCVRTSTKGQHR